jgi:hypothetical protein
VAIRTHQPAIQFHQSKPDDPAIHFEEQRHVFLTSEKVVQRLSPIDETICARLHPDFVEVQLQQAIKDDALVGGNATKLEVHLPLLTPNGKSNSLTLDPRIADPFKTAQVHRVFPEPRAT